MLFMEIIFLISGTTGNPKGVMLSADNITWTVRQAKVYISYFTAIELKIDMMVCVYFSQSIFLLFIPFKEIAYVCKYFIAVLLELKYLVFLKLLIRPDYALLVLLMQIIIILV